jgi:hypothetical protein
LAVGCVTTAPVNAPYPLNAANDQGPSPISRSELDYREIPAGFSEKFRFARAEPRTLVDGVPSRFRAFALPPSPRPLEIEVVSYTSYEVPGYPVKYLFCPRIILLDSAFDLVGSTSFWNVKTTFRMFGEPRFELRYLLTQQPEARYLLIVREPGFDEESIESNHEDDSGQYDSLGRKQRERIYSSRTGRLRLSIKPLA